MKLRKILTGAAVGLINGFFGALGGVAAVIMLEKMGFDTKKAHAAAVGIIMPVSVVSLIFYFLNGKVDLSLTLKTVPFGVAGAAVGGLLLKKINPRILKGLFALLLIYSGINLLVR